MVSNYTDDITLLAGFQAGEGGAQKQVFHKYFRTLCLYSERITGYLEQSEDIVSESFEKVWDRRGEFQTLENMKAFLYRIVRNASINYSVAQKRHETHHENIRYLAENDQSPEEVMENEILRVELLQEIYNEIENLPDKCGQIFKLLFIHELTTEQIANRLSINIQTVRSQKARAIQLIKTQLLRKNRIQALILMTILLERSR